MLRLIKYPLLRRWNSTTSNGVQTLMRKGLIEAVTSDDVLKEKNLHVYVGCDPTASSLHVGNLFVFLAATYFNQITVLVGGGTGLVGDPSGKTSARVLIDKDILRANEVKITEQLQKLYSNFEKFQDIHGGNKPLIQIVNNYSWLKDVTLLDFLRNVGPKVRVNEMLARDSVKNRDGVHFGEFAYQLLQSYDFLHLSKNGVNAQLGGADQWGNITAGLDMIKKFGSKNNCYGVTVPLLTTPSGEKFGKSAGNAVFLDKDMTAPFQLYQFFINTPDNIVQRFFTLLNVAKEKIPESETESQKLLAKYMTWIIHGEDVADACDAAYKLLNGFPANVSINDFDKAGILIRCNKEEMLSAIIARNSDMLRREVNRTIAAKGVTVNGERISKDELILPQHEFVVDGKVIVRVGKSKFHVLTFE